jgi:uncharacterized membrane protein YcfT
MENVIFETIFWTVYVPFVALILAVLGGFAVQSLSRVRLAPATQSAPQRPQGDARRP